MLSLIKYDPTCAVMSRAAGRALVGSANFSILNAAARVVRQKIFGVRQGSGIDGFNDMKAAELEDAENTANLEEQGHATPTNPLETAGLLLAIATQVSKDLEDHATTVVMPISGKEALNPWEVAPTLKQSFTQQQKMTTKVNVAVIKAEAEAMGVEVEVVESILKQRDEANAKFLKDHESDIFDVIDGLTVAGYEDAEEFEDKLPAISWLRLFAAVDNALVRTREREATNYLLRGREYSKGNVGLIDIQRRLLWEEYDAYMAKASNKASLDEAFARGATMPKLQSRPKPAVQAAKISQ